MLYYLDCEFDGHNGPLISMALVSVEGMSLYVTTDVVARDPWVIENVIPILHHGPVTDLYADNVSIDCVGSWLRRFIGEDDDLTIVADVPGDIARFCTALSTAEHGGWASSNYKHIVFEVRNVESYPTTLPNAIQHHALWDALALRELFKTSLTG